MIWDVVIIGAGICGASAARELSKYNLKILLLEKGSDVCFGTSKGNSATVHSGYDPTPGSLKAKYNVIGNAMFDQLSEELEFPFVRNGMIVFATDESQLKEINRLKDVAAQNKVPVKVLDNSGLREIEPNIGDNVIGGLWAPTSGQCCPYSMTIAMAESAVINGATVMLNQEVIGIESDPNGWKVKTQDQEFVTKTVLNAAGTHAGVINNMVSEHKINIIPREGQHILLDRKYFKYVNATICQTPKDLPGGGHTKGMGIMPSLEGTVILGCNANTITDLDDASSTADGIASIISYFEENWEAFPIARDVKRFPRDGIIAVYGGVRAHPETDDFIIGEVADAPRFYNAAGIESPGLTAGPAIAEHLAGLIVEELQATKKENFIPGRKFKKPFREMNDEQRRQAIQEDPDYAKVVCRCEHVTEAEIRDAIHRPIPATSVNAIKMRVRAGMGRCQGGFCGPKVLEILKDELNIKATEVPLYGPGTNILVSKTSENFEKEQS